MITSFLTVLYPAPICNKNHKKENIRNFIEGVWGSGEYCGEKAYRLYCYTNKYQNSIHIVSVKLQQCIYNE